jgi:proteic killer suppression protein
MIKSFKSKETEKVFNREFSKKLPHDIQLTAYRKLGMINIAINIRDLLLPPSNRFEMLSGKRKGQYSIRINKQWRVCFIWSEGNAYEVEITDYH